MTIVLDVLIILWSCCIQMLLMYLLRADACRLSRRTLTAFCIVAAILNVLVYIPYTWFAGSSSSAIASLDIILWVAFGVPAWWMYPGRGWQNLFLWWVTGLVYAVCVGPGNMAVALLADYGPIPSRLAYVFVTAAVSVLVMAGVLSIQRRFIGLYGAGDDRTWRQMAVIAGILFAMVFLAGNVLSLQNTTLSRFLFSRLVTAFAMLGVLYIAGLAQRQAKEAAEAAARAIAAETTVKQKEEAYADIVESVAETARLRHDMRQIFTAMQGMNEAGNYKELEAYCQEVLTQIPVIEGEVNGYGRA